MENELCGLSTALITILKKETLAKILSGSFQRPPREGNLHGTGNGDNTDIFFFIENEKKKKSHFPKLFSQKDGRKSSIKYPFSAQASWS